LNTLTNDIVWIAGGKDELTNYQELVNLVSRRVKALICIGKDNSQLIKTFEPHIPLILQCRNMDEAVRKAFYAAEQGSTVLLSTASPCDNSFEDYQARGNAFKKAIAQL
jgi:UDP-N-acetylmuramoylalanine--D-glutamate ligase